MRVISTKKTTCEVVPCIKTRNMLLVPVKLRNMLFIFSRANMVLIQNDERAYFAIATNSAAIGVWA